MTPDDFEDEVAAIERGEWSPLPKARSDALYTRIGVALGWSEGKIADVIREAVADAVSKGGRPDGVSE